MNGEQIRVKAHEEYARTEAMNAGLANRKSRLKRMYGITVEEYDRLLEQQGGVCAICKNPCPTGRQLSIDHNHETGKVRGLLCSKCNFAIGLLSTQQLLRKAIKYLERTDGRKST